MKAESIQTNAAEPSREWFSVSELADLALPGLPGDRRSIDRRAREERWHLRTGAGRQPLARPRVGRGGGTEFHVSLLPGPARLELDRRGLGTAVQDAPATPPAGWAWYEVQSAKVKAEAERRVAIVAEIELLCGGGMSRSAAVTEASDRHQVSTATLWNWLRLVEGVAASDRLPALAPRRRGGGAEADVPTDLWDIFRSDYLRDAAPSLAICYAKVAEIARARGVPIPSEKTFRRKVQRDIPAAVLRLARGGEETLRRSLPAQRRSVAEFHALEVVNMDGHKFDVFVTPPDGGDPIRPIMIGIQDVMSRKLLAWRIGTAETAGLTRLVFADLFANFGIPKKVHLDNGRAFASKWITGGAKTRFRFKILDEEPTGLLTGLGVQTAFTLPYRGQSKPIERAWRDLCDSISRCAAFDGAYTGNNTLNKPESYGKRAVPWDEFVAEVNRGIAFHNARPGRRTETARGRSFDEVFAESYATAPIGKATPEQMRMALLTAENVRANRQTGEIALFDNRYWAPFCSDLHGQKVTVRFDPENLWQPLHLYDLAGRYLGAAELLDDKGFDSADSAKQAARLVSDHRRAQKDLLAAERRMTAAQVAAAQREIGGDAEQLPEPEVIRPVRYRGQTAAALKVVSSPDPVAREQRANRTFAALDRIKLVK